MEQNTTSVVIEQQGENKKRGALAVILAVAFVAMLGIGSTFAYMTWSGNQTPNRFTVDVPLSGDVVEPAWQNVVLAGKDANDQANETASDGQSIPANAGSTEVGKAVAKNPYVVNTSIKETNGAYSAGSDAYAGIRLTFQKWVKTGEGTGDQEEGHYTNMTKEETVALLQTYAFTSTEYDADTAKAGLDIDSTKWNLIKESDGTLFSGNIESYLDTTTNGCSVYYAYTKSIKPAKSDGLLDSYPEAGKDGATEALFTQVYQVKGADTISDDGGFGTLLTSLKASGSKNPGWRVLVDGAVAYAAGNSGGVAITGAAQAGLATAMADIQIDSENGASPTTSVSGTTYNYLNGKGSGSAKNISDTQTNGLPQMSWDK